MKKFIDIVFPDLDDKNVRIELDDARSPKTFKAILENLPIEISINKWGEEALYGLNYDSCRTGGQCKDRG